MFFFSKFISRLHPLRAFHRDIKGSVATIFAVSLVAIMVLVTGVLEYAQMGNVRINMQDAADAAALAAARASDESKSARQKLAHKVFRSNLGTQPVTITSLKLVERGNIYSYRAQGKANTQILKLVNVKSMPIKVTSDATASSKGAEIALVFDVTASMGFGSRWRKATKALAETLDTMKHASGARDFYATLLPMGDRMRVPAKFTDWLSKRPRRWDGCIEVRSEPTSHLPYRLTDNPPNVKKFQARNSSRPLLPGWSECPSVGLTGPTHNVKEIEKAANNMRPRGTGRFDIGMAWAFRVLSPNWRGHWDLANYPARSADQREKIAVLITDGNTNAYIGAYPGKRLHQFGGHYGNRGTKQHFKNLQAICEEMHKQDIKIHTVYVRGNPSVVPYLKACASEKSTFHQVKNSNDLAAAMRKIGVTTTHPRLVR